MYQVNLWERKKELKMALKSNLCRRTKKSKKFQQFSKKPLHSAGVFAIIIRRLRVPCIFAGQRYAMTREVAVLSHGFFRRVCPIIRTGRTNTDAKGQVCVSYSAQTNVHVLCGKCVRGN